MVSHLFMTDAEIAKEIGQKTDEFKATAVMLERKGFPMPDPLFNNRRYWPAVKAFFDRRYNMQPISIASNSAHDGETRWKKTTQA